jgi:hypothetical protein
VSRGIGRRQGIALDLGERLPLVSAQTRLRAAIQSRKKRQLARVQGQEWFRDDPERARDVLRGLLHEADSDLLVIDPYFGAKELYDFALAVGQSDIPIRILTSYLIGKKKGGVPLADAQRDIERQAQIHPFEIRVMKGKKQTIHDRFFVVDEKIWHIGSSLNNFGERGTMIVALPDPAAVRGDLDQAWKESKPLDAWRGTPQDDDDEETNQ